MMDLILKKEGEREGYMRGGGIYVYNVQCCKRIAQVSSIYSKTVCLILK